MDHVVVQQVARLKIRLRQDQGVSLNTQRFFCDSEYASQLLDLAEESDDFELVEAAMDVRNRLGWLQGPDHSIMQTAVADTQKSSSAQNEGTRYKFGARS